MNIRAHHLLCMKYFKGKGYSNEFISNLYTVIENIEKNPTIKIINYPDIICNPCPHNVNGKCIKKGPDFENEVREKDNRVIRYLGVDLNEELKAEKIKKLVDLRLDQLRNICKDCEWLKYCVRLRT